MKKTLILGSLALLVAVAVILFIVLRGDAKRHDEHAGHNCDHQHEGKAAPQSDPARAEASRTLAVTREQVERLGIKIATAATGTIRRELRAPGEIRMNADRMARVVPRAVGVARDVLKTLGDPVRSGDILAWIESDELAEAKLDFYAKESEVGCCEIKLPQAKAIFENVARLTALLKADAGEKEIRQLDGLEMGAYRGQLLTAYAAYRAAETIHARESGLRDKEISSAQDLLTAETDLQQARAAFHALKDTARFETLIAYAEAIQERQTAAFNAVAAEKQLRLKGVGDEAIAALRALVPKPAGLAPCPCDDPQCKAGAIPSVSDALGRDPRFAWYALRAPLDGTVVEKHITPGEAVDVSAPVFTIADLSEVWVDLAVSQNRIGDVQAGFPVTIQRPDGTNDVAEIRFVSQLVSLETRTALARAAVNNTGNRFRPGAFVDATILLPSGRESVVIPKSGIQLVNDHPCVFVWGNGAFELRDVETGATDGTRIEVLKGLQPGEKIAAVNAFHLKAEYTKTTAGDLGACHGHSH